MAGVSPKLYLHLDLKGAVPSLSYLEHLLTLFKSNHMIDGLLIEYEDTFPFSQHVHVQPDVVLDLSRLMLLAKNLHLDAIPLLQTLGHTEYLLKLSENRGYREHPDFPDTHLPIVNEEMLDDVADPVLNALNEMMERHDNQRIHVGCDEAWQLGRGRSGGDKHQLLLNHVSHIQKFVKRRDKDKKILVWDDMMRDMDPILLENFVKMDLNHRNDVELVVWRYNSLMDDIKVALDKYSRCGLKKMWVASAFKGADNCDGLKPNLRARIDNQFAWRQLLSTMSFRDVEIQGVILTGWQRFDHFAVLCDLLPVSVPSLISCIRVWQTGRSILDQDAEEIQMIDTILGLNTANLNLIALEHQPLNSNQDVIASNLIFPGLKLYYAVTVLSGIKESVQQLERSQMFNTWCNEAMIKRGRVSKLQLMHISSSFQGLKNRFDPLESQVINGLKEVFDEQSVLSEWVDSHLEPIKKCLRDIENRVQRALSVCNQ